MNASEGTKRIAIAIRWLGDGFGGLFVLIGFGSVIAGAIGAGGEILTLGILALVFGGLVIGGGRIVSWIIKGFAESKAPPSA